MSRTDWPFDQAPDAAAITLWRIVKPEPGVAARAILYVSHDLEDEGWQFLDGEPASTHDAAVVGMGEMLALDPTLREIADLPPGWIATRERAGSAWRRSQRG